MLTGANSYGRDVVDEKGLPQLCAANQARNPAAYVKHVDSAAGCFWLSTQGVCSPAKAHIDKFVVLAVALSQQQVVAAWTWHFGKTCSESVSLCYAMQEQQVLA